MTTNEKNQLASSSNDQTNEEVAKRKTTLFEADFNVYADRGNNCYKSPVTNDANESV